jgi:hypothetical protein
MSKYNKKNVMINFGKLINKENCEDLFRNSNLNQKEMFHLTEKDWVSFKFKKYCTEV